MARNDPERTARAVQKRLLAGETFENEALANLIGALVSESLGAKRRLAATGGELAQALFDRKRAIKEKEDLRKDIARLAQPKR